MLDFIQSLKDAFKGVFLVGLFCTFLSLTILPKGTYCGQYYLEHYPRYEPTICQKLRSTPQPTIRQKAWQAHRAQVSRILYNH